jgi:predicted lipid-binding transport protein (Tim44 family)
VSREPHTVSREPHTVSREPHTVSREPHTVSREPHAANVAALLLVASLWALSEAEARVGGGQDFSTGSSRSSGSGGSGGSGGEADLVFFLIRLCFYYPEIGVPLLVLALLWMWWQQRSGASAWQRGPDEVFDGAHHTQGARRRRRKATFDLPSPAESPAARLTASDPTFSEPALHDLLQLVFRRAWEARTPADADALAPFVSVEAYRQLAQARGEAVIDDVVIASVSLTSLRESGSEHLLTVRFTSSRTLDGRRRTYQEESWTFHRARAARSLPPEAARRLGCPSCGAAVQCDPMGRCVQCHTPITEGQLQWQANDLRVDLVRELAPPELRRNQGRDPSLDLPSRVDPYLAPALRAFNGRHADFNTATWERRLHHVFLALQQAWSEARWQDARPYLTDAAWNTLRFWLDRYERAGLRNRLADARILRMQLVKVTLDPWYESVTVRFWAELRDWVERLDDHKVVAGDARTPKPFSEYWTFIRAVGSGAKSDDPSRCPSCGAPLDHINAAGVCGYCDSVITTGQFDWVLSRIEQVEVYTG